MELVSSNDKDRLIVITLSTRTPGAYKKAFYDQLGPISDEDNSDPLKLITSAIRSGFDQLAPGKLDEFSESDKWMTSVYFR